MEYNGRYIPEHIRITGNKRRGAPRGGGQHDREMSEVRAMEAAGVIPVDHVTEASVRLDRARLANKRKKDALRKNKA